MLTADLPPVAQRIIKPFGLKAARFAVRPIKDDAPVNILEGAVRSAKTWALHAKILQGSAIELPKGERVLFGATKTTIKSNVLNDLFNIVGEGNYGYNSQSGEMDIFGARWRVVGAKDEGSEKVIRGSTVAFAVGDELVLIPRSFLMMLRTRMSVPMPRLYGSTNPDTPFHYVKTELLDNTAMIKAGDLYTEHFTLADNPNLEPPNYKEQLERQFPPGSLYHQRFVLGLWVTGEGAIYKDVWTDELLYADAPWTMGNGQPGRLTPVGLRDPGKITERAVSIDCGVDHVQVYLDVLDDGTDLWFDREYWWDSHVTLRQKTDHQYRVDLEKFLTKAPGAKCILPPECASFDAELTQSGIWHCDADNEVLDGIKMTASLMALRRVHFRRPPEGYAYAADTPFHDHVGETIKQLQTYQWNAKASVRGVEEPLKVKDDGPDAVRYKIKTDIPAWRINAN
jgi:hypothetical protein